MGTVLTTQDQGQQAIGGDVIKRQAADTPFQSFKTDTSMFDGGLGDTLTKAGSNISKFGAELGAIQLKEREDKSTIKKMELEGQILDQITEQKRIFSERKLGNAEGAAATFKANMATFNGKIDYTGLTKTDEARMKLFQLKQENSAHSAARTHELEQRDQNILTKGEERVTSYTQAAAAAPMDEELYGNAVDAIIASVTKKGKMLQQDDKITKLEIRNKVSAMNLSRIKSVLSLDTAAGNAQAKKIFEDGKKNGTIEGNHFETIQNSLKSATVSEESRRQSNVIMNGATGEADALGKAKKIKDTAVYDETVKRIKNKYAVDERLRKRAKEDRFDDVSARAADVGKVNTRIPEAELDGLSQREKAYIRSVEQDRDETHADPDHQRSGDGGKTWAKWIDDSSVQKPIETMTLGQLQVTYETGVTKDQFEKVILPEWRAIRVNAGKKIDKAIEATGAGGLTAADRLKTSFEQASKRKVKDDGEGYARFKIEYDRRVLAANTKEPKELDAILKDMVKDSIVYDKATTKFGDDDIANAWTLSADQLNEFSADAGRAIKDEDDFEKEYFNVLNMLEQKGWPITRDNIINGYNKAWTKLKP